MRAAKTSRENTQTCTRERRKEGRRSEGERRRGEGGREERRGGKRGEERGEERRGEEGRRYFFLTLECISKRRRYNSSSGAFSSCKDLMMHLPNIHQGACGRSKISFFPSPFSS
eukprot:468178-Hanusia_phi.AAC.2